MNLSPDTCAVLQSLSGAWKTNGEHSLLPWVWLSLGAVCPSAQLPVPQGCGCVGSTQSAGHGHSAHPEMDLCCHWLVFTSFSFLQSWLQQWKQQQVEERSVQGRKRALLAILLIIRWGYNAYWYPSYQLWHEMSGACSRQSCAHLGIVSLQSWSWRALTDVCSWAARDQAYLGGDNIQEEVFTLVNYAQLIDGFSVLCVVCFQGLHECFQVVAHAVFILKEQA